MYTYISITAKNNYVELEDLLDPSIHEIGTTWEDYLENKWILLNDDQLNFKEVHPLATVQEVFNMEIKVTPEPVVNQLAKAKRDKLQQIEEQDYFSNRFFISVVSGGNEIAKRELWIDKNLRNSLYSITLPALLADGQSITKLWTMSTPPESIDVPISWALEKLPLLEIYAKKTYDIKSANEAAVYTAETVEEVNNINVYDNYPVVLTFVLDLDTYEI